MNASEKQGPGGEIGSGDSEHIFLAAQELANAKRTDREQKYNLFAANSEQANSGPALTGVGASPSLGRTLSSAQKHGEASTEQAQKELPKSNWLAALKAEEKRRKEKANALQKVREKYTAINVGDSSDDEDIQRILDE